MNPCIFVNPSHVLYFKVWSSGTGKTHSPPSDLVMKTQKWLKSKDLMKAELINSDGDVSN